ncbi:hypothetical protein B0H11DRAFT_1915924 [Mycena galericulata]|nr:hypothetical protein B0H11DRAFT_1931137 [Mycena galericulata]KAJ7480523.1 hypothetical protein B0H11DRAFT_1915924 [Mycena galericulata]
MPPRATLYQTRLEGYFLVRAKGATRATTQPKFLPFEGESWFPIDVDAGSRDNPIDVEFWTYLWDAEAIPLPQAEVDPNVFRCCICWETLHMPVVTDCLHIFCRHCISRWVKAGRRSCPVCRAVIRKTDRDGLFEAELATAITAGAVPSRSAPEVDGSASAVVSSS